MSPEAETIMPLATTTKMMMRSLQTMILSFLTLHNLERFFGIDLASTLLNFFPASLTQ
jgi:hypothetical protein